MRMLTINDKMTTSNSRGVGKHVENTMGIKLDMIVFFFKQ